MSTTGDAWAQLISSLDFDFPPVLITNDEFTIGRAKACDLSIDDNKMVSGKHCKVIRDRDSKKVWLEDSSTNGTIINMKTKVSKGQRVEIHHGDELHIVFRKDQEESNVAFLFQDMAILENEMSEETLEYSDIEKSGDETQEYEAVESVEEFTTLKRSLSKDQDTTDEPAAKKTKSITKVEQETSESPQGKDTSPKQAADCTDSAEGKKVKDVGQKTESSKEDSRNSSTKLEETEKETKLPAEIPKTDEAKECKETTKVSDTGVLKEMKSGSTKGDGDGKDTVAKDDGKDTMAKDEMEEALLCGICQDILHDCISLQPCMHSFCASCYSPWMERANDCPSCRNKVARISRNHIINNLIEAYLKEHPEKKRSDEEIKELNSKNKITDDMIQPKVRRRYSDEWDSDEEEEEEEDDDDDGEDGCRVDVPAFGFGARVINAVGGLFGLGMVRPPQTICRQCPGNVAKVTSTSTPTITTSTTTVSLAATTTTAAATIPTTQSKTTAPERGKDETSTAAASTTMPAATADKSKDVEIQPSSSAGPSTSTAGDDAKPSTSDGGSGTTPAAENTRTTPDGIVVRMPVPLQYVCAQNQVHLMCLCCKQAMPDRRTEATTNPEIPAQQCDICYRGYCHMYWGCKRVDCYGCLNHFRDMNFGKKSLVNIINDNHFESEIFRNYMEDQKLTVTDVLTECLARLDRGEYVSTDAHNFRGRKGSDVRICYPCGLRNLKELAYQFRRDIPRTELPGTVTSRPDCYWGKNCRTQRNRPHHAARFNHVCDQIRT
ncbi:E3 ubiquitin-protein ligase CHFR-like [Glandiceps talaboti]